MATANATPSDAGFGPAGWEFLAVLPKAAKRCRPGLLPRMTAAATQSDAFVSSVSWVVTALVPVTATDPSPLLSVVVKL